MQQRPTEINTMEELKKRFPSMKRALFSSFHIGGCQSCAYQESDTLAEVCTKYNLDSDEVIREILLSQERDNKMQISPKNAHELLQNAQADILLLDCRTREEHDAVKIADSLFLTQELQDSLFTPENESKTIFLYDHTGATALDTCSWFHGHGLKETRVILGGIDRWAQDVDSSLPRYRLELD